MYLATLDTPNFEFLAVDDTREEALELMRKAWDKHREQTNAYWDWQDVEDSVFVTFIRQGDIIRNGELIHSYDSKQGWTERVAIQKCVSHMKK